MQFAHPNLLWLLLVIPPAMVGFYLRSERKRRSLMAGFIQARLLPALLTGVSEFRRNVRLGCFVLAICLVIVALARPQWGFAWEEVKQRGLDIVVAIDVSKSMLAEDIQPNRLARAKLAAMDLLQQAHSDRLGLVAFSGSAFLQCPLTIDDSVFRQSLEALDVNTISAGGTDISEAIQAAMGAFTEEDNFKVLVLFTDGEDHDSGALVRAKEAAADGLEIFTIGVGTEEGELLRIKDAAGKSDFARDENGNVVKSRLNERILQELAGCSARGFYLPLRGAKVIDTLYSKGLAPLPKGESGERLIKRFHERFHWPLAAALVLLIAEILYPERKRARQPGAMPSRILGRVGVGLMIVTALAGQALGSPGKALRDYRSGEYDKALQEYNELLKKKPADPRLHFNAGAAAYKERQFEEAAKQFNEAMVPGDLNLQQQAYYNRGNTFFQLGDAVPDPKKKEEFWQRSLQDYESALKLNTKDGDAAHNRNFVKQKLEELKQQQEQQKQDKNDKKDQDEKDQNDQQQQQDKDQQKEDQQQQDKQDQQKKEQEQHKDKEDKDSQSKPEEKSQEGDKSPEQKPGEEPKKEPEQQKPEDKPSPEQEQKEQEQEQHAAGQKEGQMSPQQARQLLDAEKGDEKVLQLKPKETSKPRPLKDW